MQNLFEAKYNDEISAKDGGFVFQAIISHEVKWQIKDGEVMIDHKDINSTLHQVDVFPDLKFNAGAATSAYVILSEVNILKRKFELASEVIKKRLNPQYAAELENLIKGGESFEKRKGLNATHFKNTYFEATLYTNRIVLREVSSSGINESNPRVTLKLSTGMVNTLDNQPINSWNSFLLKVDGSTSLTISNQGEEPISAIQEYDSIENTNDLIFRTIVPSLILEFKGEAAAIDSFTQRSARISSNVSIDYKNLFNVRGETIEAAPAETPQ